MAGMTAARPAPAAPPPALRTVPVPVPSPPPALWWVGCHGGAGVTTLAQLTGVGVAVAVAGWPRLAEGEAPHPVVLVARSSAAGTWAAMGAVEQARERTVTGVRVLGLVMVAASPRKPPRVATDRMQLLAGWVPRLWRVQWQDALLAVEHALDVGLPPDVDALRSALGQELAKDQIGA